jgi:hypothetical protein
MPRPKRCRFYPNLRQALHTGTVYGGLQIFRANEWISDLGRNSALSVSVKSPEVTHNVRIIDFENWLEGSGKSPADQALKVELRGLLTTGQQADNLRK